MTSSTYNSISFVKEREEGEEHAKGPSGSGRGEKITVWDLSPINGGATKRRHKGLPKLHENAPAMYDELLARVGRRLSKEDTFMRYPLEPGLKLALTLHHIISGNMYASMKFAWRVPHNTISVIVPQVCEAIIAEYMDQVMVCPSTPNQWHQIADRFLQKWNFPHTCGAIDGKHVACRCPENSGSMYFNYKGFYSILLFAMVDADYKFIWADIGGLGSASDAQVFNGSELKECIEDGTIDFPDPEPLPNDTQDVPFFIIGDAFSLRTTLMKPYSRRCMSREERIFNYRISRARRVVENAFGILSNRFQVMPTTMKHQPSTVKLIVTTCVVLHNLMRIRYQFK
ncbi:HARBI1 [Branchiostoma lanceolatum]|uniref:HARBI1 protein n=1 Tax=Branchiostoma lanceolatum TaxID=7740 RepID=A0A8J9Z737_BRALA|nr:HARBI1 [Branchiostoma lanceolatum]